MTLYVKVRDFVILNIVPVILQAILLLKEKKTNVIEKIKKTIMVLKDGRGPPVSKKLRGRKEAHKKG